MHETKRNELLAEAKARSRDIARRNRKTVAITLVPIALVSAIGFLAVLRPVGNDNAELPRQNIAPSQLPASEDLDRKLPSTLEFDRMSWTYVGKPTQSGDVSQPSMEYAEYACNDPSLRVIELTKPSPSDTSTEGVYERILQVQTNVNGRWISHGRTEYWMLNGEHEIAEKRNGEPDGVRRIWHANGEPKMTESFRNGQRNGKATCWYDNGQIQWWAEYANDREIGGEAFTRDGTPL